MNDGTHLGVISDDEVYHYDNTYAVRNPLTRLFGELTKYIDKVTICCPTNTIEAPLEGYIDSRINFVERPFYSSVVDFLKKAPCIMRETYISIRDCILNANYIVIRIPSPVASIAWMEARRSGTPYSVYVAGDIRNVVSSGQKYSGLKAHLANGAAKTFHTINQNIAKGRPTFVMGNELESSFSSVSSECVNLVPSVVSDSELVTGRNYKIEPPTDLLYCGRLAPVKGVDTLLQSINILRDRNIDIHLTIVGDGPQRNELEELAQNLGINDSVSFEGYIAFGEDLLRYYKKSDAFVLPSRSEGIPKTLIEAMGSALPLIATTVGGVPDLIENERTGLLVRPNRPQYFANKIDKLVHSYDLRKKLGEEALTVAKQYTVEKQARIIGELLLRDM